MIEVKNLSKTYGDRWAIRNLNFKVNKGEVVGFLGPNGAGKSTTMKIITGYMAPSSGEVQVAGFDVFESPLEVKRRIGYLPETPPVYTDMRVQDYLEYVAKLKGLAGGRIRSAVDLALQKTSLTEVRSRMIGNLSKGFRQRVGLAQAIVSDPEILILDEPTVGLDPKQVAEIRELILQLRGQHTIVLSTHILSEVQASCDKVIIINKGQIAAVDELHTLTERMSKGAINRVHVRVRRKHGEMVQSLTRLAGVHRVVDHGTHLDVEGDMGEAFVESVAEYLVKEGVGLLELKMQTLDLEDIFLKLTSEAGA